MGWSTTAPGYSGSDGWSLHYAFRGPSGFELEAQWDGSQYVVAVTAKDSAKWWPGDYVYSWFVLKGDDRKTLGKGQLKILEDLSTSTATDVRSHAKRMLDAIEATLEKRATKDQQSYEVDGKKLERIPVDQLIKLQNIYKRAYRKEQEAAGLVPRRSMFIKPRLG